ncbi:MAG: 50S ribosomal protein L33 [Candidatus Peribacteria bacterium]|nr:50S ribosomal protein L33 [Candidatus Peribacteria bacterium]
MLIMAAKKKGGIVKVALVCVNCKATNYYTSINKAVRPKLTLKKYCKHCKKTTEHNSREKLK